MKARLSRRELVGSVAVAGGLLLARPGAAWGQGAADMTAMLGAVRLEQALGVAYAGMAARPRLGRDLQDLLLHLADHERQHAAALLTLAEYIGVVRPKVPTLTEVEIMLPSVRAAVDRPTTLAVLDDLERAELRGFYADEQILTDVKLIESVGAVMCSDAQHLAVVRQMSGIDPIPTALETGNVR